jgi:RimJ/RimL family protein N-acetyltransferase
MILAGQRERVAAWVAGRIRDMDVPPDKDYEAIGFVGKGGDIIGGVIFTNYMELAPGQHDIRLTAAGEPGWLTRTSLRVIFGYPFSQLSCIRVSALCAKANKRSRDLVERLGFVGEGNIRHAFGVGRDGIHYGLLKDECRWIKE